MEQEHIIAIHIREDVDGAERTIKVDGQKVYQDNAKSPYTENDPIGHLERFLLKESSTPAPHTLMDDPYFIPEFKFPEEYYWMMPLWKNRKSVAKRTFLGWCMRVIERAYLAMQSEPYILYIFPIARNHSLPPTPDDLEDMRIILPCRPLSVPVQEALRSCIELFRLGVHQWSTRLSDKEIPDGYIAVLERYHGGKLISRQGLLQQQGSFGRVDIVSQKLE